MGTFRRVWPRPRPLTLSFLLIPALMLFMGCGGDGDDGDLLLEGRVTQGGQGLGRIEVSALGDSTETDDAGFYGFGVDTEGFDGGDVLFTLRGASLNHAAVLQSVVVEGVSPNAEQVQVDFLLVDVNTIVVEGMQQFDGNGAPTSVGGTAGAGGGSGSGVVGGAGAGTGAGGDSDAGASDGTQPAMGDSDFQESIGGSFEEGEPPPEGEPLPGTDLPDDDQQDGDDDFGADIDDDPGVDDADVVDQPLVEDDNDTLFDDESTVGDPTTDGSAGNGGDVEIDNAGDAFSGDPVAL